MGRQINKIKKFAWEKLPFPVAGVDEAGRGCLAGPVYASAVILKDTSQTEEYTDSKLLSPEKRKNLAKDIWQRQLVGIGWASQAEIETLNILWASLLAMKRAVLTLNISSGHLLVDGKFLIPDLKGFLQRALTKGELRATPIAAASIVAKVARDHKMTQLAKEYPQYGFEVHKGYGTKQHKEAISRFGPCFEHRKTFAGVKEHVENGRRLRPNAL